MMTNDTGQIIAGLHARKAALFDEIWQVASMVAEGAGPEALTRLVRLKVDIEAIEFAIANAPEPEPDEESKVVPIRA